MQRQAGPWQSAALLWGLGLMQWIPGQPTKSTVGGQVRKARGPDLSCAPPVRKAQSFSGPLP